MDLRELRVTTPGAGRRHPWERARLEVVSRLLRAAVTGTPKTILDLGCGDAYVVEELAGRYPSARCVGVDTELTPDELARLRQGLSSRAVGLYQTLRQAVAELDAPADVVLLLDVIEHVEDDVAFLEQLRRTGTAGRNTLVLVTVPAHQRLFSSHDVFLRHHRRYDQRTLLERLARAGFRIEQHGQFFLLPLAIRAIQAALERWLGAAPEHVLGAAGWKGGDGLTRLATSALVLDFAGSQLAQRLGIRLPGLSSYALCRTSAS
jgi:SAM-dependent methyltransferase